MSAIQVEGLWGYIQTLALSNRNKQWLATRLLESTKKVADSAQEETDYLMSSDAMQQIVKDGDLQMSAGQGTPITIEDLWK